MTLQSLPAAIPWPGVSVAVSGGGVGGSVTLDAAGEYAAFIFQALEDMVISHVGYSLNSVAGSPTADIRIETVDAAGLPSGTLWAANTNIVTGTLVAGWTVHALTAAATITKGQFVCVKLLYNSGTSILTNRHFSGAYLGRGIPYAVTNTGTPTKGSTGANAEMCVLGSSATDYYRMPGISPITSLAANTFNNTSSAKRGVRFKVPFRCRAVGLRHYQAAQVGDYNAAIFDDAGAELSSSSTAFDGNLRHEANSAVPEVRFDNPVTLEPGTWYRAAIEPTSATNCNITTLVNANAGYMNAMLCGPDYHYTTYVASSWTDSAVNTVPLMDIIIDQLDDGAGGGGGMLAANMRGNMQ